MVLTGSFEASEIRRFKLRTILERIGTKILTFFVRCSGEETVAEILQSCSQLLSQPRKKRQLKLGGFPAISPYDEDLQKAKQEVLRNPTKPTLCRFDITFLNRFLTFVPQDETMKDEAKELRKIVKLRNEFFHGRTEIEEEQLGDIYEELEKMLPAALDEVERIGSARLNWAHAQNKRDEIEEALQEIRASKINLIDEIKRLRVSKIDELLTSAEEYLRILGHEELVKSYKNQVYVNPVAFLLGKTFNFHLDRFYTVPEFKLKDNNQVVHFEEILNAIECESTCSLVEGPPGIGKTTFNRLLLAKKSSGERFQHLWIIPFECRNKSFDSLAEVIEDLFPEAARDFTCEKLCRAVIALRPLFLIDGLDERNEKSRKVVSEILLCVRKGDARFLATSRPEAMEDFLLEMEEMNFSLYKYFELTGIARDDLDSMVGKYCKVFSEAKGCSSQVEKTLVGKVVSIYHHLLFESNSPLILCLITYLIVSKESDTEACETRTSLYSAIFDAFYKKLKLRLRGKEIYQFTERKFRSDLAKFINNLYNFSFTSLRKSQLVFSFDEIAAIEENLPREFGEEAISAIFVIKKCFTRTGLEEFPSYSFPHKSFQEFLAAKQIFKEIGSLQQATNSGVENVLATILRRDLTGKKEAILFLSGLLAARNRLTPNLCNEIFASLQLKKGKMVQARMAHQLIQESGEHPQFVELTSNHIKAMSLSEENIKIANLVLQRNCLELRRVKLELRTVNEDTTDTLRYLKDKEADIELRLHSEITDTTSILRKIHGGKCAVKGFLGRIDLGGIKLLSKSVTSLYLYIATEKEIDALTYLAETSEKCTPDNSERDNQFKFLKFEICDAVDLRLLPRRLFLNSRRVVVKFASTEIGRYFQIVNWLCSAKFRPGIIIRLENRAASFTFEHENQLACYIKEKETDHMIYRPLFASDGETLSGDYTEKDVEEFPAEIGTLWFNVCGPVQAAGLNSLVQRLRGGNSQHLRPIKILRLKLAIHETCDVDLLPETLPSGSGYLDLLLEASSDLGGEFDWLLRVMRRLPKREWCAAYFRSFKLTADQLEILLEILQELGVKAKLLPGFRRFRYDQTAVEEAKLDSFTALQNRYEQCHFILEPDT